MIHLQYKHAAKQVGFFGDLIEGLAIKFIAGLLKIKPEEFKAILDQLIPFLQYILKLLGVGGTVKFVSFMAKNPKRVVQMVQQAMDQGE